MRQPFLLVKRDIRGNKIWYAKFWDNKTRRYLWKSIPSIKDELEDLGAAIPHTSKAGSARLAQLWIDNKPQEKKAPDRLDDYLREFWKDDSDFISRKSLRGKNYSSMYIQNNRSGIEKYFLVFLKETQSGDLNLDQVTTNHLESFLDYMTDMGKVGTKRINDILQAISVALGEAHRLRLIPENPAAGITKLQDSHGDRKIFTPKEVKAFFAAQSDPLYYTINLLVATTGLRLGECRGLLRDDIKDGCIEVRHNWQDGEGMKAPKWGSARTVPVPIRTMEALQSIIHENPYENAFIFWGNNPDRPIDKKKVSVNFNGIVEDKLNIKDRTDRGLTFHSWRHWYNSMLRGTIPDHSLRMLTGHSSEKMTDGYSAVTEEQRMAVSKLANKIF